LKLAYAADSNRVAAPLASITRYASVAALKAGEALTNPEDIALAVGFSLIFHGAPFGTFPIVADGLILSDIDDAKWAEATKPALDALGLTDRAQGAGFFNLVQKTKVYVIELVMCQQVKALKRDNLLSYFKGAHVNIVSTDFLTKALRIIAATWPSLVGDDTLRTKAIQNKFVAYHIAYASSGTLICRVIDDLGRASRSFFTETEEKAALASRDAPWDIGLSEVIRDRSKALAYAYLKVNSALPDNWYQGTKAWDSASPGFKRDATGFFRKMKELASESDGYSGETTLDGLLSKIPRSLGV
jgi:hypothetical protein